MEKVTWSQRWAVTGVAAPRGDAGLWQDRRWPSTEALLPGKNTQLPAWENPRQAKSWERLHKESGHLSKEWAALSGERDVRSDTRQGLPRQGAIEWFPLKSQALCFSGEVDNAQTITVPPVCRMSSHWHWLCGTGVGWRGGEETLFISADQGSRIWSEGKLSDMLSEHPRSAQAAGPCSPKLKPRLNHSTFSKTSVSKQMGLG